MCKQNIVLFFLCISLVLSAQLPETDLWLFQIKTEKNQMLLGEGKNITARKGYDNQPCFTPDNKGILYVSIRDNMQSDVYNYSISKQLSVQFTKTKISEYSPNYTPDGKFISCVVVEEDSAQRIWIYHTDGSVIKRFSDEIDSVGYYSWLSRDTLLYYKLTVPHSLKMHIESTGKDIWLCDNPSRTFKKIKNNIFIYAIKDSVKIQYRIYNTVIKRSDEYANHQSKSEDFIWNPVFGLVKSEGTQLLRYDEKTKVWLTLFDFTSYGIKKITRFAFDSKNKQVVIVDNN